MRVYLLLIAVLSLLVCISCTRVHVSVNVDSNSNGDDLPEGYDIPNHHYHNKEANNVEIDEADSSFISFPHSTCRYGKVVASDISNLKVSASHWPPVGGEIITFQMEADVTDNFHFTSASFDATGRVGFVPVHHQTDSVTKQLSTQKPGKLVLSDTVKIPYVVKFLKSWVTVEVTLLDQDHNTHGCISFKFVM